MACNKSNLPSKYFLLIIKIIIILIVKISNATTKFETNYIRRQIDAVGL